MSEDKEAVRERAYQLWEEEGRPDGRHAEHWHAAEAALAAEGASANEGEGANGAAAAAAAPVPDGPAAAPQPGRKRGRAETTPPAAPNA